MVCLKTVPTTTNFQNFIVRTMLCGAVCFFLYQISGDKTLVASYNSTGFVIKYSLGFLILSSCFGILGFIGEIMKKAPLSRNPVKDLVVLFLMFIAVGLFEELAFRAVINDAIVYKFRNWRYVFVLSAVVSSLSFGAAHIIGFDTSSPLAWGQAIGKTLSAGVFGLALLILYWKTRNIWACGIAHGLYDFFASFSMGIFNSGAIKGTYVLSDDRAVPALIAYGVITLICAFITLFVWKKVGRQIDFDEIRRSW